MATSNPECYGSYNFRLENLRPDDVDVQWFTLEITASIAFHRDRVHPFNRNPYRVDRSKNGQPSGGDSTKAKPRACSLTISPHIHKSRKQLSRHDTLKLQLLEKSQETECAIEHQRQATRRRGKQTDGTTTDETLSATTPGKLKGGPQNAAGREIRPTRHLTAQHVPPGSEMRTLFTEKLSVTPRQIENDPDGRSRPPATPTTEKPRSEQRRTRFATKKRNPSAENNISDGREKRQNTGRKGPAAAKRGGGRGEELHD
ncbi:hypothetical protein F2Q70_00016234 [Brassica cretica]|uniref:Uncharacterized protein n=1 Tax=Brassica cretica TaxID=69181 RepID=A0A8S9KUR8_BRACR|nr:hypothetical protein F2Q70_00016234 [Brassica cretica]KAF2599280.1 hypothetical protein F2Q68_00009218 [Brassica cretica]